MLKLDHIQLAMPPGQEAAARAYFATILGLIEEPKPFPLSKKGGCWFRAGPTILHIGVDSNFVPQKQAHPAFIADDLDALGGKLTAAGYPVLWDTALTDRRRFFTSDPFGNRIEFLADGDGFSQKG